MQLYQSQQVYQLDRLAIEHDGQPGVQLMQRAALAVWRGIQARWPERKHLLILAGSGNNGGDAFALAVLARQAGYQVAVYAFGDLAGQSPESAHYRQHWEALGGEILAWQGALPTCDLLIDGLLGIGLNKPLNADWTDLIDRINRANAIRISIDIPSGLQANTGVALPVAVRADLTVTFIGRKLGCLIADGPDYCGELLFDDLGISASSARQVEPAAKALTVQTVCLPPRRLKNSHKNDFGHVLVIGGDRSMSGAVCLAGMAALRSGAGVVSLCVNPDNYTVVAGQHSELMVGDWSALDSMVQRASVIVIGPGLGQSAQSRDVLQRISALDLPMVIDADALVVEFVEAVRSSQVVMTPHPGEAARLLDSTARAVQSDRPSALQKLLTADGRVCVLKGAGTLIGEQGKPVSVCTNGHAGMATAGMGDVLAGLIGGYLAQGLHPRQAADTAVLVHALAAESYAATFDEVSLIATDVIARIGSVQRRIRQSQDL